MYPFDVVVTGVSAGEATIARADPGGEPSPYGTRIPAASVGHFANDLRAADLGRIYAPLSGDPVIDAVIDGSATFLGKGDDGLAFRVDTPKGPLVVKVSTTVPYQPFNPNHLTPDEAIDRLKAQQAASAAMIDAGVPGILPSSFVEHGDRGFVVKPYVEIPERLTRRQLDEVAASVEAAHKAGWVFRDELQVGLWDGHTYHFDTGKAEYVGVGKKSDPDDYWSDAHTDVQSLKRLFSTHGERYMTAKEKQNPIAEFESLYHVDARRLTPEQRKQYRGLVLRLGMRIKAYLTNRPDEDNGMWSLIPEYADEEIRAMMAKFKEPTT